jgi:hypothetical protein
MCRKYIWKITHIVILRPVLFHSLLCVVNFMLPACRPNFAEVGRTTKTGVSRPALQHVIKAHRGIEV